MYTTSFFYFPFCWLSSFSYSDFINLLIRYHIPVIHKLSFLFSLIFLFFFSPIVPGVILTECTAQTAAILLSTKVDDAEGVPVLTRIQDARFKQLVKPGDTIDIHVTLNDSLSNAFFLTGKVQLNGRLAVRVELACALAKMD